MILTNTPFPDDITKETVEDEIEKYRLIDPSYDSDDDRKDKVKLTGKGIDFKALKAGQDVEFEFDPSKGEDEYNWEDEDDVIDYAGRFKYKNQEMVMGEADNENEDDSNDAKTPFEILRLKMSDISPGKDKKVLKRVIETGIGAVLPVGSRVRIHYNGYFEMNDEPFDSTYLRNKSFEFKLGNSEVIAGLDIAVSTMRRKEKSQFIIDPEFYCGKFGCEPRVPKETPVLFEIEVISYIEANAYDQYEMSSDDQRTKLSFEKVMKICNCLRELGNDNYLRKNYREASKKYRKGLYLMDNLNLGNDEEEKRWKSVMLKLYLNMSQICLKLTKPKKTIFYCKLALDMDPENVKALFRYGCSLRLLQDFDRSRKFLTKAYNLAPSNKEIADEIERLEDAIARYKTIEKDMCKRMFNINVNKTNTDLNNNQPKIMQERNSLEKSRDLITETLKEFVEDKNRTVYNVQLDMYSLETINFILEQCELNKLETREIKGAANILQVMKK